MDKYQVYVPKLISGREPIVPGHRACQGCAEVLAVRYVLKALGRNTVIANATGCMEIISSAFPTTAWEIPWIHVAFENAAAVGSGVEAGLKVLMRKGRIPQKPIKAVAMGGDGGTSDIGLQALSGALERGHDMLYVCFDNEAYMNTGIQRSSATPFGAMTTTSPPGKASFGQMTWKKNMAAIAVAMIFLTWPQPVPAILLMSWKRSKKPKPSRGRRTFTFFRSAPRDGEFRLTWLSVMVDWLWRRGSSPFMK